jgi:hypothetical protein
MATFQGRHLIQSILDPVSVTSDEAAGNYVDFNGYNRAFISCQAGLVATGDTDDTVSFQVLKSSVAAATADSDDETAITAAVTVVGPPAGDSDTVLGMEHIDIDLVKHGLTSGSLIVRATASEGCAAACAASIILYDRNGIQSDTAMTIVSPASS